MSISYLI